MPQVTAPQVRDWHAVLSHDEILRLFAVLRAPAPPAPDRDFQRWAEAARAARDTLVLANRALVVRQAMRYRSLMEMDDVIGYGHIGLLRAIDKFDPDRGHRFSTYAVTWIRQVILRALRRRGYLHIPGHMHDKTQAYLRAEQSLRAEGHRPSRAQITHAAGLDRARYRPPELLFDAALRARAINAAPRFIPDFRLVSGPAVHPLEACERERTVGGLLRSLDARERRVVELHFGLNGHEPAQSRAIAAELRLTPARVNQILRDAIQRMRWQAQPAEVAG